MLNGEDGVRQVPGIGPKRARTLAAEGIEVVDDLLRYLPMRYEDRRTVEAIEELEAGSPATVVAEVVRLRGLDRRAGVPRCEAEVADETGRLRVVWFHQPYLAGSLDVGDVVWLHGKVSTYRGRHQMANPTHAVGSGGDVDDLHLGRIVPVYRRMGSLTPGILRRLMATLLDQLGELEDELPEAVRRDLDLMGRREAYLRLHRPPSDVDLEALDAGRSEAHRRLAMEEFLAYQTALRLQRRDESGRRAPRVERDDGLAGALDRCFPFELTDGQRRALDEILADLEATRPMHRLLQGDVGCGKTAVAGAAMVAVARQGGQAALMAPTEMLARQHAATLDRWTGDLGLAVELLTGSRPADERERVVRSLADGEAGIVVGTHALLQPDVSFASLDLAVVDEQHRFGVGQRLGLRNKGRDGSRRPHLLVMTATPIPRSLALTAYGDLDVSTIPDMPPGRRPPETRRVDPDAWPDLIAEIGDRVAAGQQAFVVAPRIESVEEGPRSATAVFEHLRDRLPEGSVVLVHGDLDDDERNRRMEAFVSGRAAVLVATTVVEVGIDVPTASLMIVEHAERFGLSQLHQLRGRIGRGDEPGSCVLIARPPLTEIAEERLSAVCGTTDGFELAERDLELRGAGELLGTRQAGASSLRVGDPERDLDWLLETRIHAARLVRADDAAARRYRERVRRRWRRRFELVRAG